MLRMQVRLLGQIPPFQDCRTRGAAVASNSATKVEVATEVQQVLAGSFMAGPLSSAPRLTSLLLRLSPLPMVRLDAKPCDGFRVQLQPQARTVGVGRPHPVLLVWELGVP